MNDTAPPELAPPAPPSGDDRPSCRSPLVDLDLFSLPEEPEKAGHWKDNMATGSNPDELLCF